MFFGQAVLQIVVSESAYVLAWVYKPMEAGVCFQVLHKAKCLIHFYDPCDSFFLAFICKLTVV